MIHCMEREFTNIYNAAAQSMSAASRQSMSGSADPSDTPRHEASLVETPDTVWVDRSDEEQAERITRQVAELREMGFHDEALSRRVLVHYSDLSSAVEAILRLTD